MDFLPSLSSSELLQIEPKNEWISGQFFPSTVLPPSLEGFFRLEFKCLSGNCTLMSYLPVALNPASRLIFTLAADAYLRPLAEGLLVFLFFLFLMSTAEDCLLCMGDLSTYLPFGDLEDLFTIVCGGDYVFSRSHYFVHAVASFFSVERFHAGCSILPFFRVFLLKLKFLAARGCPSSRDLLGSLLHFLLLSRSLYLDNIQFFTNFVARNSSWVGDQQSFDIISALLAASGFTTVNEFSIADEDSGFGNGEGFGGDYG